MRKSFPKKRVTKRKAPQGDDQLLSYEKKSRSYAPERGDHGGKIRFLLPTKEKNKLTYRAVKEVEIKPKPISDPVQKVTDSVEEDFNKPLTNTELICLREELLKSRRNQLASICNKVVEDPYSKCGLLSNLMAFCTEKEPLVSLTVRRLGLLSVLALVKDIMPGYKIRESYGEDENQGKMLSKEVKKARAFESTFLSFYKLYVGLLQLYLTRTIPKQISANSRAILTEASDGLNVGSEGKRELSLVAMQCVHELLVDKPYFNLASNLITLIIRQLTSETPNRRTANECLIKVFERDLVGEVSLEVVRCLADVIKKKKYKLPPIVLLPLLHLPLGQDATGALTNSDTNSADYHKNKYAMSRKEKKRTKLKRKLERDTRETRAAESRTYISHVRSKISNIVFSIYLHILKLERSGPLLSPALEGVSHFSHVISVEYFFDLLRFLSELLSSSTHLSTKQRLYCLHTSCSVLFSQQTQEISIDPKRICQHMYTLLLDLPPELSWESTKLLINTLLLMLNNTQCMHQERALGFAKRICTCSLVKTTSYAAGLLFSLRSLLKRDFITDNLLTNDSLAGTRYQPELSDPDMCDAKSSCLWELSLLRSHYHPVIRKQAEYLSEGSALVGKRNSLKLASDKFQSPDEILEATSLYYTDPFEDVKMKEQLVVSRKRQEKVVKKYHTNLLNGVACVYKRKLSNTGILDFYNALSK